MNIFQSEKYRNKETVALIDGDIILYSVAWSAEKDNDIYIVKHKCYSMISQILSAVGTPSYIGYLTPSVVFRKAK